MPSIKKQLTAFNFKLSNSLQLNARKKDTRFFLCPHLFLLSVFLGSISKRAKNDLGS